MRVSSSSTMAVIAFRRHGLKPTTHCCSSSSKTFQNKDVHDRCVRPVLGGLHHHYCRNLIFGTDSGGPVIRPGSPSLI